MDALSDLLHAVKLNGALFLEARFTAPWCIETHPSYGAAEMLRPLNPVVFFHIVTEGRCKVRLAAGGEPIDIASGDLVLMPQGDTNLLGSDLQLAPVDADSLMRPAPPGGMPTIDHGGGGDEARILCGFLSCDKALCRLLLDALPRLLHVPLGDGPGAAWLMSLARRGAQENTAPGPGSATLLSKLAELLFVEAMRRYIETLPERQTGWLAGLRDRYVGLALGARPAVRGPARPAADAIPDALAARARRRGAALERPRHRRDRRGIRLRVGIGVQPGVQARIRNAACGLAPAADPESGFGQALRKNPRRILTTHVGSRPPPADLST